MRGVDTLAEIISSEQNSQPNKNKTSKEQDMPKLNEVFTGGFLKAEDLHGKTVKVIISETEIKAFEDGKKVILKFRGKDKALVANKTNCALIEEVLGTDEIDDWVGQEITLYTKKVEYRGDLVPAIRVKLEEPPPPPEDQDDSVPF
jgi:hypothetical protein